MAVTWECRYEALRVELPQLLMAPATRESGNVVHGCTWHLQKQRACTRIARSLVQPERREMCIA